jgi:hypothetical protein
MMTSPDGPSKETLDAFLQFMIQSAENPDPITDYFRVPARLPPAWQSFFDKVLTYCEKACAADHKHRISWEKRGMMMEDENLDEFEMLMSSTTMKVNVSPASRMVVEFVLTQPWTIFRTFRLPG